ncbi:uncharacterized protein LOC114520101 isoform X1 [Dendronephthya gigantea]|uniref:uncharacterized protein LOC114520101 isoform X1 n=1 Tax=Dendronephthya gigantea TaxID=151771 RepID=UPI00106B3DF3|nr:uncharacterized protein LOC114520101 isoform X1 [Dendronephthya gigantea]
MSSQEESETIMISFPENSPRGCSGSIKISGAKNAAFPLMAACLLTNEEVVLKNVPKITDTDVMKQQLECYGIHVTVDEGSGDWKVHASNQLQPSTSRNVSSKIRGGFLVLGPLLARLKKAKVYNPGGDRIGDRPVDYHIEALKALGATQPTLEEESDCVFLRADGGLRGTRIHFPQVSVGATETVIMAACLAEGQTVITKAAVEPEVLDLIDMLRKMGMGRNIGVNEVEKKIVINGTSGQLLNGCTHTLIPDRIEAGTWAIAAAMTGGSLTLLMDPEIGKKIMVPVLEMLPKAGVSLQWRRDGLEVQRLGPIQPVDIITGSFPQFPTDLLPQWVTFMTHANGTSIIEETIYDNRFSHIPQLVDMGASFTYISNKKYKVHGIKEVHGEATLRGALVEASDLRAGAALILAALTAKGTTKVVNFHHVLRGYENVKEKLRGSWRVRLDDLQQTRPGFHGGSPTEVRQSHHRR